MTRILSETKVTNMRQLKEEIDRLWDRGITDASVSPLVIRHVTPKYASETEIKVCLLVGHVDD